jgi:hypothetical protein
MPVEEADAVAHPGAVLTKVLHQLADAAAGMIHLDPVRSQATP